MSVRRSPLRVLQVDGGREWRGGQNQVRLLLRAFRDDPAVEPTLATAEGSRLAREGRRLGVPVLELPWETGLDPRGALRLARVVAAAPALPFDVIHAHDSHGLQTAWVAASLVGGRAALVASRRVGFPPGRAALWRRAELVLAVSGAVRRELVRAGIEPLRIRVVHDAVDPGAVEADRTGRLRRSGDMPAEAPLVGAVGALERDKGHATLVRAAARVVRERPDAHFLVAGEGEEEAALRRRIAGAGVGSRFHLPGHLPDVARSLGDLDLFVMPSTSEGFGSAALEAMAVGVPVLLARAGGLVDVAGDELPTVPPGDPEALAAEILRLLGDEEARREVARAGARRLEAFRPEVMAGRTLAAYREVLESRHRRRATLEEITRLGPLRRARSLARERVRERVREKARSWERAGG